MEVILVFLVLNREKQIAAVHRTIVRQIVIVGADSFILSHFLISEQIIPEINL